jgi:uncharacterized lipoprotein YehR (DUF1307 family)
MDEQWGMALKFGAVLLVVAGLVGGAMMTFNQGSLIGDSDQNADKNNKMGDGDVLVNWNKFKGSIGMELPAQVNGETVVFIPTNENGEVSFENNIGSADVATVGADEDESDTTELIKTSDVSEDEDYYKFSTFNSKITTDLPDSGDYKVAVIGTGVGNTYYDVSIPERVEQLSRDNTVPIQPLEGVKPDVLDYASDAEVTVQNTVVQDGDTTIALDSGDFSSKTDSDVDGTVTLRKEYELADDRVAQFGEISVSSVNTTHVDELTMTVMADGEEVVSETDSDFSDNEGLDDSVEFGMERAEDTVTVELYADFDDSAVTSATDFATFELDDSDADGDSDDGSYGITTLTDTLRGY